MRMWLWKMERSASMAAMVRGGDLGGGKSYSSVSCSICLEIVADNGERSWAKLPCGHPFHLDCIGSAFNIKGTMQCPNCRNTEKGQWLYGNGCRSHPDINLDDWMHDEDRYDLSYSEMPFGGQWCPFASLVQLPLTFEEGVPSSAYDHDILGQHGIYPEPAGLASATHPCPYIAFFRPVHPSPSNSGGSASEASNCANHWNGLSMPNELSSSYAFPAVDLQYHGFEHHSPPRSASSRNFSIDLPWIPSSNLRIGRGNHDVSRSGSFMHPFFPGRSSTATAESSVVSSMIPPHTGNNARALDRVQALQAYYQQRQPGNSGSARMHMTSPSGRSSNHRGSAQVLPTAALSDNTSGLHAWEHWTALSANQWEGESSWGGFRQSGGPDPVFKIIPVFVYDIIGNNFASRSSRNYFLPARPLHCAY